MTYARTEPVPPDPGAVIWRYMDDWKFDDLLKKYSEHDRWSAPAPGIHKVYFNEPGQLWFGFPGSFGDDKEGAFPDPNQDPETYCDRMAAHMRLGDEEARRRKERFLATDTSLLRDAVFFMAQLCGVSCWHASDDESCTMWSDFVAEKNGVAIRSTCAQVEHALAVAHNSPAKKARPSVCAVGYVDHADYFLPADGFRGLLSIIQESYAHENEVRFVAKSPDLATRSEVPMPLDPARWEDAKGEWGEHRDEYLARTAAVARQAYRSLCESGAEGFHLPVELKGLISEVVLKPGSTVEYERHVRSQLIHVGCGHVPVRRSSFDGTARNWSVSTGGT